jgi:hypothetical protein
MNEGAAVHDKHSLIIPVIRKLLTEWITVSVTPGCSQLKVRDVVAVN